jgi:hypothetical protein
MKKDLLALAAAVLLVIFVVTGTRIQSAEDYYLTHLDDITADSETVYLSIECSAVLTHWDDLDAALRDEKYVPANGVILGATDENGNLAGGVEYVLRPGDTVYDILNRAVRHNRIQMESAALNTYIKGINHLYERSCGPYSGWLYFVGGEYARYGCNQYKPKNGDYIEWRYTCDSGYGGV